VFSDDGEPEERDAPALRPGAHSPTAGIRHMTAAVLQLQEARVAAAGGAAGGAASACGRAATVAGYLSGGADGEAADAAGDSDGIAGDSMSGTGSAWASLGGFDSDAWASTRRSTPTADLARRLAEVRAGMRR
jgi:hypothetical protein